MTNRIDQIKQAIDNFSEFSNKEGSRVYDMVKSFNAPFAEEIELFNAGIAYLESKLNYTYKEFEFDESQIEQSIFKDEILRAYSKVEEVVEKKEPVSESYNVKKHLPYRMLDTMVNNNSILKSIFLSSGIKEHEHFFYQLDEMKLLPCKLGDKKLIRFINESFDEYEYYKDIPFEPFIINTGSCTD